MDDADGHGGSLGHLRGTIAPCSCDDLEAVLGEWTDKQWRENALGTDTLGKFLQRSVLEDAARVGLRFAQQQERNVAIFGGVENGGFP